MQLTEYQVELVNLHTSSHIFLEGQAGTGKTTAAVSRILRYLETGIGGSSILILLPQRTLSTQYTDALSSFFTVPSGTVDILTAGGIAQRMVQLFWPLIVNQAGFFQPDIPPTFLTLETAQYYMAKIVSPLLDQGFFESVVIDRNRLFSQLLDNLNKAAVVGFPYTEIGEKLKSAWGGRSAQLRVYDDAQYCATKFRQLCLDNNLLDFSLQIEIFWKYVWTTEVCRDHLVARYRHIIYDNVEEDTPFAHNLISEWQKQLESILMIFDKNSGYRRFLGSDPEGAYSLKELCTVHCSFSDSFVTSSHIYAFGKVFERTLFDQSSPSTIDDPRPALEFHTSRYYPEMLTWVADSVAMQVFDRKVPPSEIVILAPFLSDALRYGIVHRLEQLSVPVRSHRPSRSLREEPVTHALLTFSKLAHSQWNLSITKSDFAYALLQTIEGIDLVRSNLLAEITFRTRSGSPKLEPFDPLIPSAQERITFLVGQRYERLRTWLEAYCSYPPLELDHFIATLFGEVLSQPGFRFHTNYDSGSVTSRLIESIQKFRQVAFLTLKEFAIPIGIEFIQMVESGVIAAQYLESWHRQTENCVLLAPAYTFLMSNFPVRIQYWLDIGSQSWSERLAQPLTHPYVLSRQWSRDRVWTDTDEIETSQDALFRLITGLLNRCREKVYLGLSDLGEQGFEQRGHLLKIINRILQVYAK